MRRGPGSRTARFFGSDDGLLAEYAWYSRNPPRKRGDPSDPRDPQRTWPVGQLKPNDLGLFDVYGNVWEWCHDRLRDRSGAADIAVDSEDTNRIVSDTVSRLRRGGAFLYGAEYMRSVNRDTINAYPMLRRDNVGFRVARTLPR